MFYWQGALGLLCWRTSAFSSGCSCLTWCWPSSPWEYWSSHRPSCHLPPSRITPVNNGLFQCVVCKQPVVLEWRPSCNRRINTPQGAFHDNVQVKSSWGKQAHVWGWGGEDSGVEPPPPAHPNHPPCCWYYEGFWNSPDHYRLPLTWIKRGQGYKSNPGVPTGTVLD